MSQSEDDHGNPAPSSSSSDKSASVGVDDTREDPAKILSPTGMGAKIFLGHGQAVEFDTNEGVTNKNERALLVGADVQEKLVTAK